jgi:hypothetical protein
VKSGYASGHRECKADHDEFFSRMGLAFRIQNSRRC